MNVRKLPAAVAIGVVLTLAALTALMLRTPPIPSEWRAVRPGMKREEVPRMVPDVVEDMRPFKGFDIVTRRYRLLVRPCWWQMIIRYDERDEVASVSFRFTDPNCGFFNKTRHAGKP